MMELCKWTQGSLNVESFDLTRFYLWKVQQILRPMKKFAILNIVNITFEPHRTSQVLPFPNEFCMPYVPSHRLIRKLHFKISECGLKKKESPENPT